MKPDPLWFKHHAGILTGSQVRRDPGMRTATDAERRSVYAGLSEEDVANIRELVRAIGPLTLMVEEGK